MRHTSPKQYCAVTHRAVANAAPGDWELVPGLVGKLFPTLLKRARANDSSYMGIAPSETAWHDTVPAPVETAPEPAPPLPRRASHADA